MVEPSEHPLPKSVLERITSLRNLSRDHISMLAGILYADGGKIFGVDLVVFAVIQRSLSLIDGFCLLLERQNVLCAVPLIRLQIDSLMRLYACWLVDDPHSIALKLLDEYPFKKLKSKDGHLLTDNYLHEKVSELYPWVSRVYKMVSGFIHLSSPHMLAPAKSIGQGKTLHISIGCSATGRKWTEDEMLEAIDAFTEATKSLLHLCGSWFVAKQKTDNV